MATYLLGKFDWKVTFFVVAGLCIFCSLMGGLMRPIEPIEKDSMPLYIRGWRLRTNKSKKINKIFSRMNFFNHGCTNKSMEAKRLTSSWDDFWHLFDTTEPRKVLIICKNKF